MEASIREMEILPGKLTPVWSYNGGLPGPLIRAQQGDRLIVHFTKNLPEDTSIHWHGLRVPNDQDGVPGYTMDPIRPGETFTYDFTLPDAGTFWYHPHVNSAAQVGWGLYGPMVIEAPDEPADYGEELVLVLSDMSLDENGQFQPPDFGGNFGDLFGREGDVLLVNGRVMPELKVRQGLQQRWRVINAARTRYYTLRYRGVKWIVLGGDGGLAERSRLADGVTIVPSERMDLIFTPPDAPGTSRALRWLPTDRGYGTTYNRFSEEMMILATVAEPPVSPRQFPEFQRDIPAIDISGAKTREVELIIAVLGDGSVEMGINGIPHERARPVMVTGGDTEIWHVINNTDFAHSFHMHGFFFQVLDESRIPEWKDSIDIPALSDLYLAVNFDERPGMWMYHCHILDHAEVGMMGHIHVMAQD